MPTSHYKIIPAVMSIFDKVKDVKSILDVGAGFGKYGVLIRDHLEIRKKRYDKKEWIHRIDAVEVWPGYVNTIYPYVYDCIYLGQASVALGRVQNYDVILLIEVLEHLQKKRGEKLIKLLLQKYNKAIVISFPETFKEGACSDWPNPAEEHRCLWTYEELKSLAPNTEQVSKTVFQIIK